MKKLLLTLIIAITATLSTLATEVDTLWLRIAGAGVQDLDFTPDDKYVIAWTNAIEFWEVQQGVKEFSIPIDAKAVGDYNYNKQYLVFAKDNTPKLLDWQTKEVVEGFAKEDTFLGRIKTAKSKNEFMATKGEYPKVIYFWDINQKQILDSFEITKEFKWEGQTWGRSIQEYDYLGNNDEYFYIRVDDNNSLTPGIPEKNKKLVYSYLIYDRESKQLVDSLYSYDTSIDGNGVDKLVVMNDRSKIAWNNKGGVINFFDVYTKKFYDWLIFDDRDFVQVGDIEFNHDSKLIGLTQGNGCCRYLKIYTLDTKEKILQYNVGSWGQISFSSNNSYLITSIASILSLYGNQWDKTAVPTGGNSGNLIITPNPVSNSINIRYSFDSPTNFKLSLYDLTGNQINIIDEGFSSKLNYSIDYNISYLPKGTYFIKLIYGSQSISQKFIKE